MEAWEFSEILGDWGRLHCTIRNIFDFDSGRVKPDTVIEAGIERYSLASHLLAPMRKLYFSLLVLMSALWFKPIVFIGATYVAMELVCVAAECERPIAQGKAIPDGFQVLVRLPASTHEIRSVLLAGLPAFLGSHPGAILHMPLGSGESLGGVWNYTAVQDGGADQIIQTKGGEGARLTLKYRVAGQSVTPLRMHMRNPGILFTSLPIAAVFTWLFLSWVLHTRRKMSRAIHAVGVLRQA